MATGVYAADIKVTQLPEDTAPTPDDLIITVNDPGGTPATRKATIANALGFVTTTGLTVGRPYYISAANTLTAADATSSATLPSPAICVAVSTTICAKSGILTTTGLTAGSVYYVPVGVGVVTTTVPSTSGNQIQRIGVARSTTVLDIMPSIDVGEIR